jgi:ubiquinone/menaquinone biosynthesis C-methylase UbiE
MEDQARELLQHVLSSDPMQRDAFSMLERHATDFSTAPKLLDLGAGDGSSAVRLMRIFPKLDYTGLDIESSPEVSARAECSNLRFVTYDGVTMPFEDASFDVVFSKQVLEHVRQPDGVIAEVRRVLRPGGLFVGSCSQLEPYQSHSIFNWTAFGIFTVFSDHGVEVKELSPGVDGLTLILRRLGNKKTFGRFFVEEGLLNYFIDMTTTSRDPRQATFRKLVTAGHIVWAATVR